MMTLGALAVSEPPVHVIVALFQCIGFLIFNYIKDNGAIPNNKRRGCSGCGYVADIELNLTTRGRDLLLGHRDL
jgi:hypothetical protein